MRTIIISLFAFFLFSAPINAQFSYSVKAGWSWPDIHKGEMPEHKVNSAFSLGVTIDYQINAFWGLQSGLNYKRVGEEWESWTEGGVVDIRHDKSHASILEIPLLLNTNIKPEEKKWKLICYAGPYIDIPIEKEGDYETFYGIMAAAQLEIRSHYFVRGEYQWALKSDLNYMEDRRTNMLSFCLGYRF